MRGITADQQPTASRDGAARDLLMAGIVVLALGGGAVGASIASHAQDRVVVTVARPAREMDIAGGQASRPDLAHQDPVPDPAQIPRLSGDSLDRRDFLLDAVRRSRTLKPDQPTRWHRQGVD